MKCTMSIYVANPPRLLDTSWPDFESLTYRHMLELRLHTPEEHWSVEGLDTPSKSHLPHRVALQTFLMSFDWISDEGRGATTSKVLVDGQSSNENSQTTHANQHTLQLIKDIECGIPFLSSCCRPLCKNLMIISPHPSIKITGATKSFHVPNKM